MENNGIAKRAAAAPALHRSVLRDLADVHSSQVNVDVDGEGHMKLKGYVVGGQARNTVEDSAWMVTGVRDADDRIRIG